MKVKHCQVSDNSGHGDGPNGWKRIVAAGVVGATAIISLLITDSMESTAAIVAWALLPLGVTDSDRNRES
jgi:hypothetical protein